MNHRAAILSSIGFWALMGSADVLAQGALGQPESTSPESASDDDDSSVSDDLGDATPTDGAEPAVESTAEPADAADATPDTPADETAGGESATETHDDTEHTLIEEDVQPTVLIFQSDKMTIRLGGLMQVHVAPYVGDESQLANDDIATSEGFRLRRARLGIEGAFGDDVKMLLVINPLDADPDVGTVSSARLTFEPVVGVHVNVGTDSVPFTRAELDSSRSLSSIERPLVARSIVPGHRLGVTVEGMTLGKHLGYVAGFMNGTEGYEDGNRFGGFMYAARLQGNAFGNPSTSRPTEDGLAISVGGLFENRTDVQRMAASADIFLIMARAMVKIEMACDRTKPQDAPTPAPGIADEIERCGAYAEFGYTLPRFELQPVLRAEFYDNDRNIEDSNDVLIFTAGVNARVRDHTRVQLHYLSRRERYGDQLSNDAIVMNLQGDF